MMKNNPRLLLLFLLGSACIPGGALAQTAIPAAAPSDQLDDIIVSARKTDEKLTDVPLAITALTAATISNNGITDLTQIARITPGLTFQNQSVGRNDRGFKQYVIRGIIPNSSLATRQTVTVFVDGAPVSGGNMSGVTDIERVEVIKGPQSAFFGRSTFAGAINVVTKAPSYDVGGTASMEYSSFNSADFNASMEGGLIPDKLAIRLSGRIYHTDGQYTDATYPSVRLGRRNTNSISLSILAQPTDTLKIRAFATRWTDDDGLPANGRIGVKQLNCAAGATGATINYYCGGIGSVPAGSITWDQNVLPAAYGGVQTPPSLYNPNFISHLGLHRSAQQYRVTADQELGQFTLSAIGSYGKNKWGFLQTAFGADYRPVPNPNATTVASIPYQYSLVLGNTQDQDAYGELRLSSPAGKRVTATLGANYAWANTDNFTALYGTSGYILATPHTINRSNTYGVFGNVRVQIVEGLSLSGEGRYQVDKLFQTTLAGTNPQYSDTFKSFSPRAILQYEPTSTTSIYASYSEGNRPGEFNTIYAAQPAYVQAIILAKTAVALSVKEDKIRMGEVGFKGTLFDNRLRILLAAYLGRWSNRHIPNNVDYLDTTGVLRSVQVTTAAGVVDLKGVELETALKVTPEFTLEGTFNVAETKIKRTFAVDALTLTGNANPVGNRLPFYPEISASASAAYQRHAFDDFDGYVRGEMQYTGKIYESEANLAWTNPATILNLRVGLENARYRFELFCTNLTDNTTPTSLARGTETLYSATGASTGTAQGITLSLPDRRTFGGRLSVKF